MKKVLFVSSEAVPFIKTGGLADVVGSLPKYFKYCRSTHAWMHRISQGLSLYVIFM